jgi:uncharacterized protein (DUF58 family)
LLDPSFLRELEALRRRLLIRARSGAAGERVARRRGGSAEFEEHRAYVPGDDLRRVDWLAYARTGHPVLKLFRTEEDAVVRLLVDTSASLGHGDPSKLDVSRRLAAALGYMALAGSQRAQVLVAGPRAGDTTQRPGGIGKVHQPRRSRGALTGLLRDLDLAARGGTDLSRAIQQLLELASRPGLLVVLSDFFDAGPVISALGRARAAGHDVALIQVLARSEVDPDLEGDFQLVDSETAAMVEVTMDASAVDAYLLRLTGLVEELRGWSRKHGASYVRTVTDEPLEQVVRRIVARGVD